MNMQRGYNQKEALAEAYETDQNNFYDQMN